MAADAMDTALGLLGHLPEGSLVIIKDSLAASGSFLLHHYISRLLAAPKAEKQTPTSIDVRTEKSTAFDGRVGKVPCKVCLVAFDQKFSHFANVGRKQGVNLVANAEEGALRFVDGISKPFEWGGVLPRSTPCGAVETSESLESFLEGGLQELSITGEPQSVRSASPSAPQGVVKQIETSLGAVSDLSDQSEAEAKQNKRAPLADGGLAIVFDDLGGPEAACQGSAHEVLALLNWCRTLRSQNGERASVVALVHGNDMPDGEKGLASIMEHSADLILQVEPLSTGAAADIHGQLLITQRTNKWMDHLRKGIGGFEATKLPRQQKFQFRLLETGVKLLHIGGSKGGA
ncbi:hypothetical protein KFL_003520060 [Klebsormidium nitens]|uniref:Elongator complex protein 6 n=1 Tax=Klebsormidium nitens TaxID=105231 RepID=A0A1Y1IFC2_KLENI|nr:hypothetical protein KFL_003520060 [Klebsormidium nitens]|eukprot:GAQ87427.1 hypothetical protein KFL_003520060 [Klebsormidium nitens]